jgi:hypothetical protein
MRAILLFPMRKAPLIVLAALMFAGCGNTDIKFKVLIGATTIPSPGAQPIEDSVVVVAGKKIRAIGLRKDVPIPQNSDRTDLEGKWIVPAGTTPLAAEEPADLLILDHAPNGVTPANASDVGASLAAGAWKSAK